MSKSNPIIILLAVFTLSVQMDAYSFHGGGGGHFGGGERNFGGGGHFNGGGSHHGNFTHQGQGVTHINTGGRSIKSNSFHQNNVAPHQQRGLNNNANPHQNTHNGFNKANDIAGVHHQNAAVFKPQHLTMNPHQGIPNRLTNNNLNNNNRNWNNNNWANNYRWNNNNWNNNWNGNYWGGNYWNNGWIWGAVLGAALLYPYVYNDQPYYSYYPYSNDIGYSYQEPYTYNTGTTPYTAMKNNSTSIPDSTSPSPPVTTASNDSDSTTLPSNEMWQTAHQGNVPDKAVINNNDNGKITYYCKVNYMNKLSYGVLVPNDGCYVQDQSVQMRFTDYDVLVNK